MSRFNQYGGSFSGPVRIPKLLDGRNRVFFMFAYEGEGRLARADDQHYAD